MPHSAVVSPSAARRAARTVSGHGVVGAEVSAEGVRRADRYRRWLVARRMNLPVDFISVNVLAAVSGSRDDDYSGVNEPAHGGAHGVVGVLVNGRRAEAQVDDAYVVERAIRQDPVERGEHG